MVQRTPKKATISRHTIRSPCKRSPSPTVFSVCHGALQPCRDGILENLFFKKHIFPRRAAERGTGRLAGRHTRRNRRSCQEGARLFQKTPPYPRAYSCPIPYPCPYQSLFLSLSLFPYPYPYLYLYRLFWVFKKTVRFLAKAFAFLFSPPPLRLFYHKEVCHLCQSVPSRATNFDRGTEYCYAVIFSRGIPHSLGEGELDG